MTDASFECVKHLNQYIDYSCSKYLIAICSQKYSEDKMKSIDYLIACGTPLSDDCLRAAIGANDLKTMQILEHHRCSYPTSSYMKIWNVDIFKKISKWSHHRVKYLFCVPDNQIHLALTPQHRLVLMLKQSINDHRHDDFKDLFNSTKDIPYVNDFLSMTLEYKNLTLAKFLLENERNLAITLYSYGRIIKPGG